MSVRATYQGLPWSVQKQLEKTVERYGETTVNRYLTRAAMDDQNPDLSSAEREQAVKALVNGSGPATLSSNEVVIEDKIAISGFYASNWKKAVKTFAAAHGVTPHIEDSLLPPKTFWEKLGRWGKNKHEYTLKVEGNPQDVAAFFDSYHAAVPAPNRGE